MRMRVVLVITACLAAGLVCMKAEDVQEHQSAALFQGASKLAKLDGNVKEPSNETQHNFGEFFAKFLQVGPKASKVGNCTGSTQPNPAEFFEQLKSFYQKWSNSTKPGNSMMTGNTTPSGFMPGRGTMTGPGFVNMFPKMQEFSWLNATWANMAKITWSRFYWNRTIATGVTIREAAFIPNGSDVIVFRAEVMSLKKRNVISCTSVFDATNSTAIVTYVPDNMLAPCLLSDTDLTFNELKEDLATQNGSHVTRDSKKSLYVSASPLTSEEADALKESNPSVRMACAFRPIHRVRPNEASDEPANRGTTVQALIVAPDSVLELLFHIDIFLQRFDLAHLEKPALP